MRQLVSIRRPLGCDAPSLLACAHPTVGVSELPSADTKSTHFCDQPKVAKNLSDPCARKIQQAGRWVYTAACLAQQGG